ncbi:hypothetical protein BH09VER1_BH09VER1_31090 [soil metagenome]
MARALALTQFIIVSLGAFVLHLLFKIDQQHAPTGPLAGIAEFLAHHALWLFAVPIIYAAVGGALEGRIGVGAIRAAGVVLLVSLIILFGIPICVYLF